MSDIAHALRAVKQNRGYWAGESEEDTRDRDVGYLRQTKHRGYGLQALAPIQLSTRQDAWGGALRDLTQANVGPRREDDHYYAPRYTPVGFAAYHSPVLQVNDWKYYRISGGWRVAIPRWVTEPQASHLVQRIYQYGPQSAGYIRLGDTLVPGILTPGDRQTLAREEPQLGPVSSKYLNY